MEEVIEKYVTIFFVYAVLGWIIETVRVSIESKKFVNRGFLIGPYCPIYGVGVCLLTALLHRYVDDIPVLFCMSMIICGLLEYFTSYIMEKLFNARWWDYSDKKFNINGRICLENIIPFGIAGVVLVKFLNPLFIDIINYTILRWVLLVLIIGFIVDFCFSFNTIWKVRKEAKDVEEEAKDETEEIKKKVRVVAQSKIDDLKNSLEKLNRKAIRRAMRISWRTRRLIRAFPTFEVNFKDVRKFIEENNKLRKNKKEAKKADNK